MVSPILNYTTNIQNTITVSKVFHSHQLFFYHLNHEQIPYFLENADTLAAEYYFQEFEETPERTDENGQRVWLFPLEAEDIVMQALLHTYDIHTRE